MNADKEWQGHKGSVLDSAGGFDVIECESCQFKHIIPLPAPEELNQTYKSDYYLKEKPLYLERHREDLEWWTLVYENWYSSLEKLLPANARRILDVGSGPGFFLLHGKQKGWQTIGMEPSGQAAAHSRTLGLNIVEDFFTSKSVSGLGTFDVIHMSNVLEHVPNPTSIIELAKETLNPNGLLFVVVPNDYSPFQSALRKACGYAPWWVAPPHHVNYFDFDSLEKLLIQCGFNILERQTTFPIDLFLLMGENYIGNDQLGRNCHEKRKTFELNLHKAGLGQKVKDLYAKIASLNIGREVVCIAQNSK
ncbi:3-demethylubiquinone-9 3-methyltransferase [sediment metagenome]|uniref:3-demethylubiquinone-9 3-methyltransferase n=1 Tax=sediment metagenome TaxID=749907 RepID=D9PGB3_9ZZZZ